MNRRIAHRTLSALIVDQLRQSILAGVHVAGTQLRQDALAETYNVSRIPVREALFQLEAEGLVRIAPHKGAVVSELSLEEINDVFDLRAILEPRLLAHSLPLLDSSDFDQLESIQTRFRNSIATRNIREWGEINAEFHLALYSRASQPRSQAIVAGLLQTSDRYTRLQLSNTAAMDAAEKEHAELIALCRARKGDEACRFLAQHIETVRQGLLRVIDRGLMARQGAPVEAGR
ncbi:MAG: GntR family transcriptional regulator [Beijerinckiaceae bacterium]|nr:GntR family transcriptional regulator [Beijerinckiaceae bacterium]